MRLAEMLVCSPPPENFPSCHTSTCMSPFTSVLKVVMQWKTNFHPGYFSGRQASTPLGLHVWVSPRHQPSCSLGRVCMPAVTSLGTATHRCFQFYIRMCLNCRNQTLILDTFLSAVVLSVGCRVWAGGRGRWRSADLPQKSSGMFKSAVSAQAHL